MLKGFLLPKSFVLFLFFESESHIAQARFRFDMQPWMALDSWFFCLHILRAGTADLGHHAWSVVVLWTEPRMLYMLGKCSAHGPTIPRFSTWLLMSMGAPGSQPRSLLSMFLTPSSLPCFLFLLNYGCTEGNDPWGRLSIHGSDPSKGGC